jgi:MFS family permease
MDNKQKQHREHITGAEQKPGSGPVSQYMTRTFTSFKNPVYRLYYGSMVGHWSSLNMQMFARNLLVWYITGSGVVIGILALSNAIPMILLTIPGGVLADRLQKKTIIQIGQVLSILITLGTTIAIFIGYLSPENPESWWVLAVSGVLQGAVQGVIMPSRSAIISEIVGSQNLMNAISLNNLGMNIFRIISPALAGVLIDAFGFWVVYAIMTLMIVMSTVFILFVPPTSTPSGTTRGGNTLTEALEGWNYLKGEKTIFAVLIFTVVAMILGAPYAQLLPMFTEPEILNISATMLGMLMMVSGFGAITGSLILASLSNRRRGLILIFSVLLMGLTLIGFSFSTWLPLSFIFIIFIGMGSTVQMALGNSLIQYYVDATYRGRVMSFFMLGFGLSSLGAFFAGILAEGIGVQWAVGGMAILLVFIALVMTVLIPRLRKMD